VYTCRVAISSKLCGSQAVHKERKQPRGWKALIITMIYVSKDMECEYTFRDWDEVIEFAKLRIKDDDITTEITLELNKDLAEISNKESK